MEPNRTNWAAPGFGRYMPCAACGKIVVLEVEGDLCDTCWEDAQDTTEGEEA